MDRATRILTGGWLSTAVSHFTRGWFDQAGEPPEVTTQFKGPASISSPARIAAIQGPARTASISIQGPANSSSGIEG